LMRSMGEELGKEKNRRNIGGDKERGTEEN
jgi:hypothetical protein